MLNARLATALVLLAGFVMAALWLPNRWWAALMLAALAAAAWEWGALAAIRGARRGLYIGAMVALAWAVGLASNGVGDGATTVCRAASFRRNMSKSPMSLILPAR